ncbi:hypothetical protein LINPERPRIM_LOCUS23983 [Linum perenne]
MSPYYEKLNEKSGINPSDIWINGKGCPKNSVPIRKVTKEDLIKINMASKLAYSINENPNVEVSFVDGLMTIEKDTYYGGGMASSIYHHAVQSSQYSSSRVKYQNGPDSIAVGWTVNPSLYPDNQTHMFIYTTDAANGNWFLEIGNEKLIIGTWPQKIFTSLADSANYIEWGGEVYGPSVDVLPPMGTGYIPDSGDFEQDCYARKISVINKDHIVTQPPASCILYQTSARYGLVDGGIQGDSGRVIFYGGPASAPMAFQINNK